MDTIVPVLWLLVLHGLIGGVDVLLNHEMRDRLPYQRRARREEWLHSLREAVFALLFGGLAWLQWNGTFAFVIVALVLAELSISFIDTLLEDRIRRLSAWERGLHVVLFINFGAYNALLVPVLADWHSRPAGLPLAPHGKLTWMLSMLSLLALAWSLRDALAFRRLGKLRTG